MMSDLEEWRVGDLPQVFFSAVFCGRYDYERGLEFAKEIWKAAPQEGRAVLAEENELPIRENPL